MRRAVIVGAACALLVSAIAWATQLWRDNQSGQDLYGISHITSLQADNGIGSGTRCAQFAADGTLGPNAAACGSGLGGSSGVNSVTGTAQRVSASPTTGAVVVDTIGGFYSGATSGGNEDLGANASGIELQTTTAGVAVLSTYAATPGLNQYGAASGGGLAQDSNWVWDPTNHRAGIGVASPTQPLDVNGTVAFGSHAVGVQASLRGIDIASFISSPIFYPNTGTNVWTIAGISPRGAGASGVGADFFVFGTDFIADHTNYEFGGMRSLSGAGAAVVIGSGHSGTGTPRPFMLAADYLTNDTTNANQLLLNTDGSVVLGIGVLRDLATVAPSTPASGFGAIYVDSTSKNLALKNDAGTVNHGAQSKTSVTGTGLTGMNNDGSWVTQTFQQPLTACTDYVSTGCQFGATDIGGSNITTTVIGVENDATMRGDVIASNISTPSSPTSGNARIYANAPFGNISSVNSSGVVNHGIQTNSCPTHQWLDAVSDAGGSSCLRPGYSDLSGTPPVTSTLPYAFVFLALLNTGELISGGSSPNPTGSISVTRTEYPMGFAFNNITLSCYLVNNHITSGTFTLKASRDSVDTTASLSFTSSTTTGLTYTSGPVGISSPSAADTYGLDVTSVGVSASCGSGLCPSDAMCTVIVTP